MSKAQKLVNKLNKLFQNGELTSYNDVFSNLEHYAGILNIDLNNKQLKEITKKLCYEFDIYYEESEINDINFEENLFEEFWSIMNEKGFSEGDKIPASIVWPTINKLIKKYNNKIDETEDFEEKFNFTINPYKKLYDLLSEETWNKLKEDGYSEGDNISTNDFIDAYTYGLKNGMELKDSEIRIDHDYWFGDKIYETKDYINNKFNVDIDYNDDTDEDD